MYCFQQVLLNFYSHLKYSPFHAFDFRALINQSFETNTVNSQDGEVIPANCGDILNIYIYVYQLE